MAADWKDYQEEAAEFFRSLGLEAKTDITLQGVRTTHDVDVVVKSQYAGFEITWVVECKYWNSRVSKLHVLALREIVSDTGSDRGILLAEKGFQSGASEAAALTNVHLTSLSDARQAASHEVFGMRFSELFDRVEKCRDRYWSIPKSIRIDHGLRPEVYDVGFSGARVIAIAEDLLRHGFRGTYPFEVQSLFARTASGIPPVISSAEELFAHIEPHLAELERRLDHCVPAIEVNKQ